MLKKFLDYIEPGDRVFIVENPPPSNDWVPWSICGEPGKIEDLIQTPEGDYLFSCSFDHLGIPGTIDIPPIWIYRIECRKMPYFEVGDRVFDTETESFCFIIDRVWAHQAFWIYKIRHPLNWSDILERTANQIEVRCERCGAVETLVGDVKIKMRMKPVLCQECYDKVDVNLPSILRRKTTEP